ncbi:MAG: hypothetical protein ACK48P_02860 [Holosporales bacterium]|jgi:hypothetical protein
MLEHRTHPLLSPSAFAVRLVGWLGATLLLLSVSLALGMAGYHYLEGMAWVDAFLNAAMLLGGMGQVDTLHTEAGKIFAGVYALYCGMVLIVCGGMLLVPVFHRVLHRFHGEG